jgi:prepilin-type N-terminal cleavage/methylation domain-containing protein
MAVQDSSCPSPLLGGCGSAAGFTLLEMIVALALASALMLVLVIGMRVSANALNAGDRRLTKLDRSLAIVDVINEQVAGAVPRIVMVKQENGQAPYLCFRGDAREVRFLTRVSLTHDMAHGFWLATYRVVELQDGQEQLLTSETPVLDSDHLQAALMGEVAPVGPAESLGDPAKRIELSYLQPSTPAKPSEWVAEWKPDKEKELPIGIRIQVWRDTYAGALTFAIPAREIEAK